MRVLVGQLLIVRTVIGEHHMPTETTQLGGIGYIWQGIENLGHSPSPARTSKETELLLGIQRVMAVHVRSDYTSRLCRVYTHRCVWIAKVWVKKHKMDRDFDC